ncbi:MAG: metallophosphoesterase [Spirochaetota bacterium]
MVFFLIVIALFSACCYYIGIRLISQDVFPFPWNLLLWLMLVVFIFFPVLGFFLRFFRSKLAWSDRLSWISYISLGFFSLLLVFLLTRDFVLWSSSLVLHRLPQSDLSQWILNRREFLANLTNFLVFAISAAMTGYGIRQARQIAKVKRVDVPFPGVVPDFGEISIVQISDIHIGSTIKGDYLRKIVAKVNSLQADIVAITGDLVDGSVENLGEDVRVLQDIQAKFGVYFVTGNHEYYSGVAPWVDFVRSLGIKVLLNENVVLTINNAKVLLAGVTDYNAGGSHLSQPQKAIENSQYTDIKVLLAHQPRSIYEATKAGFDLQLSGHTHGGQYFPWNFFVPLQQPYVAGLHRHENTWIYVSRGTGYWGPPLRIAAPSEITHILLKKS